MITTQKLRQFSLILNDLKLTTDSLLAQREKFQLFKNADDYKQALTFCNHCPEDYYNLRFFDSEISLHFNHRTKKFYIEFITLDFNFIRKLDFLEFCNKYKILQDKSCDKNFILSQDLNFEKCIKIFMEFCILILQNYLSKDKLFFYN